MKFVSMSLGIVALLFVQSALAPRASADVDVRRAVPSDVFLVVHAKHNPERDYQRAYYDEIWKTVEETQIFERAVKIVTSRMSDDDVQQATGVINELRDAVKPISLETLATAKDFIYAQQLKMPTSQHLVVARLTPDGAASTAQGVKNLFKLLKKYLQDDVTIDDTKIGSAAVTSVSFGPRMPFTPTVATLDDVVLLSSSVDLAKVALSQLQDDNANSKFDDPRIATALQHLPEPEDSLVFYDGRQQMNDLRQIGPFINAMSGGDPDAARVGELITMIADNVPLDYVLTVEYTEDNLNRSASYGKWLPNAQDKVLFKMLAQGKPFEKWHSWVPAGALSYSMGTGVSLHPLYEKVMDVLENDFPESKPGLEQFAAIQEQIDVHLDRDILQAFSGEYVSVTLPADSPLGGQGSVLALRCSKPDRIHELMHRAIDKLSEIPALQMQQLKLAKTEKLENFEELSVMMMAAFGVRPVIGFQDGWMIIGSNTSAVQKVLDARAGKGSTIETTDAFKRLKLDVSGPVYSISYANMAENTRNLAKGINQVGTMVPMFMAMANAEANDPDLEIVQEILALLPDVAKIIAKFDFLEARLSVSQSIDGQPLSFQSRSAILVRPPESDEE